MFKITLKDGSTLWEAWPKQEEWLARTEFEVLCGGARGPGKTAAGIAWLVTGNPEGHKTGHICDQSYILHPRYRALVLRRNAVDMGDWIAKAKLIYKPLGAEWRSREGEFKFPSGAVIIVGHLDSEDAFEKYQGHEYVRILLEEATQIPSKTLYLRLQASCRTPFKEMRRQIFLTANPGGMGHGWVRERFVAPTAPGTTYVDPVTDLTRIFMPGRVSDNPIFANDREYIGTLMGLPLMIRRAWLDGDWDAIAGSAFPEFRVKPNTEEPTEACHVVDSQTTPVAPWFHRWLSCDWGYAHNAAVYKYAELPGKQVHVLDELVMNQVTPEELGVEIGRFAFQDLTTDYSTAQRSMDLFLSPDAFDRRTSEKTVADQIAEGISRVLGPDSVYIHPSANPNEAPGGIFRRAELAFRASIVIQRATNQRVAGWMNMRALMRWWPVLPANTDKWDPEFALKLQRESPIKYQEYAKLFLPKSEVLPRLKIHADKCPKLVVAIPLARMNDPEKRGGGDPNDVDKTHYEDKDTGASMDCIDSLRYGLMGYKTMDIPEPKEEFMRKHLEKWGPRSAGDMRWVAMRGEELFKQKQGTIEGPIHFHRSGSLRSRGRK